MTGSSEGIGPDIDRQARGPVKYCFCVDRSSGEKETLCNPPRRQRCFPALDQSSGGKDMNAKDQLVHDLTALKQRRREIDQEISALECVIIGETADDTVLGSDRTLAYGSAKVKVRRPLNINVDQGAAAEAWEVLRKMGEEEVADHLFRTKQLWSVSKPALDWVKTYRPDLMQVIASAITEKPGAVKVEVLL